MPNATGNGRLKPVLILIGIFAFGAIAGVGGTRAVMMQDMRSRMDGPPGERSKMRLESMRRQLDLDDRQVEAISAIMKDSEGNWDAAMGPCRAEVDRTRQATDAKILAELSPPQQTKFKESAAKRRAGRNAPPAVSP